MKKSSLNFNEIIKLVSKPARYTGGELHSVLKDLEDINIRFGFCFPDSYEVGMSHLGMKLLYGLYNSQPDIWCERVFMPEEDMEKLMKENQIKLFGLESKDPVDEFDFLGFTLQYELSYTAILAILDLADIPLRSKDRDENFPLVIAGGPCACNPEPIAEFFDLFVIGEGEEVSLELFDLYRKHKKAGFNKEKYLLEAVKIEGVYVPSFYEVEYNSDNTIKTFVPKKDEDGNFIAPEKVRKRIILDMDKVYYPDTFVVPFIDTVHDRAVSEIFRGCIRGCRFCQAGFIYRPVREKSPEVINEQSRILCENTGYEEFSLASLSTSDYSKFEEMLPMLLEWAEDANTNISLPSLRVDGFSKELVERLSIMRKSGLTFAPEAGSQRLRDAINKNVTEEDIFDTVEKAFSAGWNRIKLYFMIGLPTETAEDIVGIIKLGQKIVDYYYNMENRPGNKPVNVSISASCFVPKAFTPFQWKAQDTMEELSEKQKLLRQTNTSRRINLSWHDSSTSFLEAVIARGDRKIADLIEGAYHAGNSRDADNAKFNLNSWLEVMESLNIDPAFYANRRRKYDEILPWDHLDYGVDKEFLIKESEKARESSTTPNCREKCSNCGAAIWKGGVCVEKR